MNVLIVGSGGREHAIAWKVAQSPKVDKIYCAPGNAGIEEYAECVNIGAMEFDKLVAFAKEKAIDLTVIGMDDPLVGGVVDAFEAEGLRVFGPRKNAAILEGSKAFSKDLMKKYNIPTAAYENFTDPQEALAYLDIFSYRLKMYEDEINAKLLTPKEYKNGYRYKFNEKAVLRINSKEQAEIIGILMDHAVYTTNNSRDILDMPHVEGGDVPLINGSYMPITEAGAAYRTKKENSKESETTEGGNDE